MERSPYNGNPELHVVHDGGVSRPSLGFPLGTALLLVVIFSLSGIFSCCYHWDKLRRNFNMDADADIEADLASQSKNNMDMKQLKSQSMTVIMPGDNVPKFLALPCPCQPSREGRVIVEVQKQPPKPPQTAAEPHE